MWQFDCQALYQGSPAATEDLVDPFTVEETWEAVKAMDRNSAPGPDGFGPSFYLAAWGTVKNSIMCFMDAFHREEVQLERVNRSYMVLLPKKPGATTVSAFRPICLQNCCVKILTKVLTTRLQSQIKKLVDLDQTGFIQGRSTLLDQFANATGQQINYNKSTAVPIHMDEETAGSTATQTRPTNHQHLSWAGFSCYFYY